MRILVGFSAQTIFIDDVRIAETINTNSQLLDIQRNLEKNNKKFSLKTFDKNKLLEAGDYIIKSVKSIIKSGNKDDSDDIIYDEFFTFVLEDFTCFKIRKNKIFQINNFESNINKDTVCEGFNVTFAQYLEDGIISKEDFDNRNLYEDFIILNFLVFQKGVPTAIIEAGELEDKSYHPCWNFIKRAKHNCEEDYYEDDEEDDDCGWI